MNKSHVYKFKHDIFLSEESQNEYLDGIKRKVDEISIKNQIWLKNVIETKKQKEITEYKRLKAKYGDIEC